MFFLKFNQRFSASIALFSLWRLYCMPWSPLCITNSLGKGICVGDPSAPHCIRHKLVPKITTFPTVKTVFFLCPCHSYQLASGSIKFSCPSPCLFPDYLLELLMYAHPKQLSAKAPNSTPRYFKLPSTFLLGFFLGWRVTLIFWSLVLLLTQKLFMTLLREGCNHWSPWGWRQALMALLKLGQSSLPVLGHWKVVKRLKNY